MAEGQPAQPDAREDLAPGIWVRHSDLRFAFVRSSGPGGQAVNKLSTCAQLRVQVSAIEGLSADAAARLRRLAGQKLTREDEVLIQARTHRSQVDNRRECVHRLRELVRAAATAPRVRRRTRPTAAMIERRLAAKRRRSERKRERRGGWD